MLYDDDRPKRGNPVASMRYKWQTCSKEDPSNGYESEWCSTKSDAIRQGKRELIRSFKKFGTTDMAVRIYNCMNYKAEPILITLEQALSEINQQI